MTIREEVIQAVLGVAKQRDPNLIAVRPDQALADLAFESLDLAQVAAELELRLGLDPFARHTSSRVTTVAELIALYEKAGEPIGPPLGRRE
jgi:hypothetical protein